MSSTELTNDPAADNQTHANKGTVNGILPKDPPQNQTNLTARENLASNPDQHVLNENLIAQWTRRLGIFTALLAGVTALLVLATGISAYFLWETDVSIEGQLHEMHQQTATTRAQVRANIAREGIDHWSLMENGNVIGWELSPKWKNTGATPAKDFQNWFVISFAEGTHGGWNQAQYCPSVPANPANIAAPVILEPQHGLTELSQRMFANDVGKISSNQGAVFVAGHVQYRDIFPDDPPHFIDWCVLVIPNNPSDNVFSFFNVKMISDPN
jgi:hypothetical protein